MNQPSQYTFDSGQTAELIQVDDFTKLSDALHRLGFQALRPTLVLVGGASKISSADFVLLEKLFLEVFAPLAEACGVTVVDGGTDAGIMRLMGNARAAIGGTFPLIGVAAVGTVLFPGNRAPRGDAAALAPYHTHFILVPGRDWGDESPWLARTPSLLSGGLPSVTLVCNGGEITWQDVALSVAEKRPTLVLAGSGRTADKLAAALRGEATEKRATELVASGLLQAIDMNQDFKGLEQVMQGMFAT